MAHHRYTDISQLNVTNIIVTSVLQYTVPALASFDGLIPRPSWTGLEWSQNIILYSDHQYSNNTQQLMIQNSINEWNHFMCIFAQNSEVQEGGVGVGPH